MQGLWRSEGTRLLIHVVVHLYQQQRHPPLLLKQKADAFLEIPHSRQPFLLIIPPHFLPVEIILDQDGREDEFTRINPSPLL